MLGQDFDLYLADLGLVHRDDHDACSFIDSESSELVNQNDPTFPSKKAPSNLDVMPHLPGEAYKSTKPSADKESCIEVDEHRNKPLDGDDKKDEVYKSPSSNNFYGGLNFEYSDDFCPTYFSFNDVELLIA